jgi:hypothetical protein
MAWAMTCRIRPALQSSQRCSVDANKASALMAWMLRVCAGGGIVSLPGGQF